MFRATFLGHHGWLYAANRARILVDPLFHRGFGYTDAVELRVYPPRAIDLRAHPPVDAVMLTHEHEGHFDLNSLTLLDRRIPVYVPARSSAAMRQILEEMGFVVHPMNPGVPIAIDDLEFLPIAADQVRHGIIEEWDVVAYLVRDTHGDGSLFTSVDMQPNEAMRQLVRERVEAPGLWAYTNNRSDWKLRCSWARTDSKHVRNFVQGVLSWHEPLLQGWCAPAASLIIGGGFSFGGDRMWLNRNVFTVDGHQAAATLAQLLPGERWLAPVPGQTLAMSGGKLADIEEESFVQALPRDKWPSREFVGDVQWLERYPPACGRRRFPEDELDSLQQELAGLAVHLYGRDLFRRLYSLTAADSPGRKPTVALALLADEDGGAYVFEYAPQACRFMPVDSADPVSEYLAVFECWAADLLAFLRCEISSTALCFAHSRMWNANPEAFLFDMQHPLFEYVHPLRMPERCLDLYRRTIAGQPVPTHLVGFARAGDGPRVVSVSSAQGV